MRPLVSCAYGEKVHLELFPDAVVKEQTGRLWPGKGGGGKRGKISGLSEHAAARLREFLMTMEVPGREPWAVTLTKRVLVRPEEWRSLWMRFRQRLRCCLTAAVYRVELQRRLQPHIHAVAWLLPWPEGDVTADQAEFAFVKENRDVWFHGWLNTITPAGADGKRIYDRAEYLHASHMRPVENSGWAVYQALHHAKGKREQLGWIGKQWGVIGRAFFRRRVAVQLELNLSQYWRFRRVMVRLLRARGTKRYRLPAHGKWLRCVESHLVEKVVTWCKC